KALDALVNAVRLTAVLADRLDNPLPHARVFALRLASRRQQAHFAIGARPVPKPHAHIFLEGEKSVLIGLEPAKSAGLISEAPTLDNSQSLVDRRPHNPDKQRAIGSG